MKNTKLLILAVSMLLSSKTFAQIEDFLRGGTEDANILYNNYMSPFMKGLGYGFNSGWYNTAKPHKTLGFDLTISFNAAIVPVQDQSFEFVPSEYNFTRIQTGPTTLPTLMGNNSSTTLENFVPNPVPPPNDLVLGSYSSPNGIGDDLSSVINKVVVPSPIIQAGIGIFKGTEVKIRWMPTVSNSDFSLKYFGIGGLHSISQWIPAIKKLPFLDISAFAGYTKISAEYTIPPGNIDGTNQLSTFNVNTFTLQLLASAHVSVVTGYIGLGLDNFKTNFKMLGTYDLYPNSPVPLPVLEDPVNLEQKGNGGFRTTMGLRLKFAIFTIHADYTFREYNTFTAGLGFSFR